MAKREDDGARNGGNDTGNPVGSGHSSGNADDGRIRNASDDDKNGVSPVAGGTPDSITPRHFDADQLRRSAVIGLGGFSLVAASSATTASASGEQIEGTAGADSLTGTSGDDTILGGAGNDTIDGVGGNNLIFGDQGNDVIFGGPGNDTIFGGDGDDVIQGGGGQNSLVGGAGDDTFIGASDGDTIEGGPGNDTLDLNQPGIGSVEILRDADDPTSGTVNLFDDDGNDIGSATFTSIENIIPCFTPGTRIATPRGECAVEELRVGDRVITRDNGLQEIRWIGQRALTGQELQKAPHLRPVLIRAGALGRGLPLHDMLVSPQHRMLINSERAALYFEDREVLASAKHLTDMDGVAQTAAQETTYVHFMFDQHEVVLSNGAWSESFQPGAQVLDGMGAVQRDEIFELFPELREMPGIEAYQAARRSLKKHEARLLVA